MAAFARLRPRCFGAASARRRRATMILIAGFVLACVAAADAQFRRYREGSFAARYAPERMPDGDFTVCRLEYTRVVIEDMGVGWQTDYPFSERNLMTRLSELTKTPISRDSHKEPNTWVVRATDTQLFNCPYVVASDAGSMLRTLFPVTAIPQITNIQFWRSFQGRVTSERGSDSEEPHLRAIRDRHGRIMVLMTHNTDVADSWEREGEDPGFFFQFSPNGYALGVDVLLHAMTH
jgi:hypothetical protein